MSTTSTNPSHGTHEEGGPRRRSRNRLPLVAFALLIIVLGGGVLAWWSMTTSQAAQQVVMADKFTVEPRSFQVSLKEKGELKAARSVEVLCEVEGRSTIIDIIAEGSAVKKGDQLVRLASNEIDDRIQDGERDEAQAKREFDEAQSELDIQKKTNTSEIRKGELAIQLAQLDYDKYEKGDWPQTQEDAKINIEQAEITQTRRQEDFAASEKLFDRKFITKAVRDEDEFALKKANWDMQKAKEAKKILETYTYPAQIAKLRSDLDEAGKELDRIKDRAKAEESRKASALASGERQLELATTKLTKLREQKEKCRIVAPGDGFVIYGSQQERSMWGGEGDQIKKGATVGEKQVLITIPDTTEMVVVSKVHESKVNRIVPGQRARVELEGLPGKQFPARVTNIARLASSGDRWMNPDLKQYETEITLDRVDDGLKPGQTARAEILIGEALDVLAVPSQAIYSKGGLRYVFRWIGGASEPAAVEIGQSNTEWVELVSGVTRGDQVLLSFSEDDIRKLPEPPPGPAQNGNFDGIKGDPNVMTVPKGGRQKGKPGAHTASDVGKVGQADAPAEAEPGAPKPAEEVDKPGETATEAETVPTVPASGAGKP